MKRLALLLFPVAIGSGQDVYDLLLKNGHVIDPKNSRNASLDIAIAGDRVHKVSGGIPARQARLVIDVSGYYVTPGLIDLDMRVSGPDGVVVDHNALRHGVTTVVDSGFSDWSSFARFKAAVVDRSATRVLVSRDAKGSGLAGQYSGIVVEAPRGARDTISTGLDRETTTLPRNVMTNVLSKHLAKGLTLPQLIERTTWNAAKAIGRSDLGSIDEGGVADISIFDLEKGSFVFPDSGHAKLTTDRRLRCVLTIRKGRVVWDTEGLSLADWKETGPYSNFK